MSRYPAKLTFERRSGGSWSARLAALDSGCSETRQVGAFDELSRERAERIADGVTRMLDELVECQTRSDEARQRASLLVSVLESNQPSEWDPWRWSEPWWFGIVTGSVGAVGLVALGVAREVSEDPFLALGFDNARNGFTTSAAALATAGGFGSYLFHEDYRYTVQYSSALGTFGVWSLGDVFDEESRRSRWISIPKAAGPLASAGLLVTNTLLRRPRKQRLRQGYERLRRKLAAERSLADDHITLQEVEDVEDDLRSTEWPISMWLVAAPLLVAAVVPLPYTIVAISKEDADLSDILFIPLLTASLALPILANPSSRLYSKYEAHAGRQGMTRLTLGPGPGDLGGVSLYGEFW